MSRLRVVCRQWAGISILIPENRRPRGTRPPTPEEVAEYEYKHRKRICIKPGITGLWQVSGRNEIRNFDEVVRLDIEYIDQWSLWLDVKILLKTFRVLLARDGAY